MASTSRSEPPSARSASPKPSRSRLLAVVGRPQVDGHPGPGDRPGAGRVGLEHDHLFGRQQLVGADDLTGGGGVLRRREVGVGAVGLGGGRLEHLGAERGEHPAGIALGADRREHGGVHGLQVRLHVGERLVVGVLAQPLDEVVVADAEAEQESAGVGLGQRLLAAEHGHRVTGVDVGDARRQTQARGGRQVVGGGDEGVPAHGLGDPQGRVAERLQLPAGVLDHGGGMAVERAAPDADGADVGVHLRDRSPARSGRTPGAGGRVAGYGAGP